MKVKRNYSTKINRIHWISFFLTPSGKYQASITSKSGNNHDYILTRLSRDRLVRTLNHCKHITIHVTACFSMMSVMYTIKP